MRQLILLVSLFIFCFKSSNSQPGALDYSFGKKGIVKTDLGSRESLPSLAREVLLQADGSMFVVFESSGSTLIAKKLPDGSPDSTYGNNGYSSSVRISNVHAALQKDGKIVVAGSEQVIDGMDYQGYNFSLARYNLDGSLDLSFYGGRENSTNFYSNYGADDIVNSILVQRDGKIVVSGVSGEFYYSNGDPYVSGNICLARYNIDGSLDETFDTDGRLVTEMQNNVSSELSNITTSVSVQTDGKIVVSGLSDNGTNLARYNPNGSLNSILRVSANLTKSDGSYFAAKDLAIQNDGKIVLGGFWANSNFPKDFVMVRINPSGDLDNTFNGKGIQSTNFRTYNDIINCIEIQGDGKIVAVGYASNGFDNAFAIARYNTNGTLDNSFDFDGKKMTYITSNSVYAVSVAIQGNGKIVAAGYEETRNIAIVRYKAGGSLDSTLNRSGKLIASFKPKNTSFTSSAVQGDGKLVVAGTTWNGKNNDFALVRYTTNGSLDNTFSQDGIQMTDLGFNEYAQSLALQGDGKIILVGGNNLLRYNIDGSLDNTFSTDGKQISNFSISLIKLQRDGKIVIAGGSTLARYNTNGSLDISFNGNGKVSTPTTASDIAIQGDGKIVVVGGRTIARYNTNGSFDNTFDGDGMKTREVSDIADEDGWYSLDYEAISVKIKNDGKIIVAGNDLTHGRHEYFFSSTVVDCYNPDGSLQFSSNEMGSGYSRGCLVSIQTDGKIVVANDFTISRLNNDGSLDPSFSAAPQSAQLRSITIANNKLYTIGSVWSVTNYGFLARYLLTANKPPTVGITSPANNTVYAAPATTTIKATATDGDGIISNVKFYNGATYLKAVFTAPYTYTLSNLPKGTYTLTAKAADNSGLQTTSKPVTVTVLQPSANKAPVVSITSPANNAVYAAPATFTVNASASDPDGTIKSVKFYRGGILLKTDSISPYSYTFSNLSAGTYSIVAVATDNKGLISSSSSVSIGVSVPLNKVPVVKITIPINNVVYPAKATINISATATDADGSIARVKFYRAGTLLGVDSISPYTYTMTNVAPGSYSLVAKATDNKGLVGSSASIAVQVNRPPVVSITSPINNATYGAPATITVKATASDADGVVTNVKLYNGTTYLRMLSTAPYTFTLSNLPAGTYTLTARATDNMGTQTISAPVKVTVSNTSIVSSKPLSANSETSLSEEVSVKLAPNPAKSIVNIYTSGFSQVKPVTINVISSSGVVLKTIQSTGANKIVQLDVSSLVSGVYTIKVMSSAAVIVKQFVKL